MRHKRLLLVACVILLLVGGSACSSTSADSSLVGSWEYTVEYEEIWKDNAGDSAEFFDFSDVSFTMELELAEDGTFTWGYNKESIEKYEKDTRTAFEKGLEPYFAYLMEEINPGLTFEDALSMSEMTKDELLDEMMNQGADLTELETFVGTYRTQGDKLRLTYTEGAEGNETLIFKCSENTLVLDIEGEYTDWFFKYLLPATFTRKQ